MQKTKILVLLFAMFFVPKAARAEDKKPLTPKAQCAQLKKQIQGLEKERAQVETSLKPLEQQRDKAKAQFESYRAKLDPMRDCSRGNPNNSAECTQVLEGLSKSGAEMERLEKQMQDFSPKKNSIDNQLLTPKAMQKALNCPQ